MDIHSLSNIVDNMSEYLWKRVLGSMFLRPAMDKGAGYYRRYSGKSKTFKQNQRKGR